MTPHPRNIPQLCTMFLNRNTTIPNSVPAHQQESTSHPTKTLIPLNQGEQAPTSKTCMPRNCKGPLSPPTRVPDVHSAGPTGVKMSSQSIGPALKGSCKYEMSVKKSKPMLHQTGAWTTPGHAGYQGIMLPSAQWQDSAQTQPNDLLYTMLNQSSRSSGTYVLSCTGARQRPDTTKWLSHAEPILIKFDWKPNGLSCLFTI